MIDRHRFPVLSALILMIVLVAPPPSARAVMITGYTTGTITADYYEFDPGVHVRPFPVGGAVYLTYTYDPTPVPSMGATAIRFASFEMLLDDGSGRLVTTENRIPGTAQLTSDTAELFRLRISCDPTLVDLRLGPVTGHLTYFRDGGKGQEGFAADVSRVADRTGFPVAAVPEPPGLVTAGLGVVLVIGYLTVRQSDRIFYRHTRTLMREGP